MSADSEEIATGITNFPPSADPSWLGAMWVLAICSKDPDVLKKLRDASADSPFDFIKRGTITDSDIEDLGKIDEKIRKEFEKQKELIARNFWPFLPEKENKDG